MKKTRLGLAWLILWTAAAVFYLVSFNVFEKGGLIIGEPDEFVHAQIVAGLRVFELPHYSGKPFFYDPPLFFWISALLNLILEDSLLSIRVVSFVSILLSSLLILYYGRRRGFSDPVALVGSLFFLFVPVTVFYSQVGLIEPLLTFLVFGFFVFYDLSFVSGDRRDVILAAAFLSLALLTKFTALALLPVVLAGFLYKSVRLNLRYQRELKPGYCLVDLGSGWFLLIVMVLVLPVLILSYRVSPFEFKIQVGQVLGFTQAAVFTPLANLTTPGFGQKIVWWFSPVFLTISLLGLVIQVVKKPLSGVLLMTLSFLLTFSVLSRLPFHQRYVVVLIPFLALFCLNTFDWVVRFTRGSPFAVITLLSLYFLYQRLDLRESYLSTKKDLFERAATYINRLDPQKESWVLSNYWPNIVAQLSGRGRFGWLTLDNREIGIFDAQESRTGLQIMEEDNTFVLVEQLYSNSSIVPTGPRDEALKLLERNYQPQMVVVDDSPNFPFFRDGSNVVSVYVQPFKK